MATKEPPSQETSCEFAHRAFSTFDTQLTKVIQRIDIWFSPKAHALGLRELFEPAVAGFVVALLFWFVDWLRTGSVAGAPLLDSFLISSGHHALPYAFVIGIFVSGVALVMAGTESSQFLRRFVSAPILRLSHHGTMLALGVYSVASVRELLFVSHSAGTWALALGATFVLMLIGSLTHAVLMVTEGGCIQKLEEIRAFRLVATLLGLILITGSPFAFGVVLTKLDLNEQQHERAAPSEPTGTVVTPKH